jgi:protein-L-isoaspartate(D-aspartate) O-methyltransferase
MVALMTQCLRLTGSERVLEIGTGSGYQAAILALLAHKVYTVERHPALQAQARAVCTALGITNIEYRLADGVMGWPEAAPFDAIIVTAGAPTVPIALLQQLGDGGRLVIPVGPMEMQSLLLITRVGDRFDREELTECRFVPLIGDEGWPELTRSEPARP